MSGGDPVWGVFSSLLLWLWPAYGVLLLYGVVGLHLIALQPLYLWTPL